MPGHVGALRPGRDPARPAHEQRGADAAFEEGRLPASERRVQVGHTIIPGAAIIAGKDDVLAVVDPRLFQLPHHFAEPSGELRVKRPGKARLSSRTLRRSLPYDTDRMSRGSRQAE